MTQEEWDKWEPRLKTLKFGDKLWDNSERGFFIGKQKQWYQHGGAYLCWDTKEDNLLVLRLEDEKELAYNKWVKEAADRIRAKKNLPWYNLTKYF